MSGAVNRPDATLTVANHEERIRILEASADCCANAGFEEAVAIRDRACSWYGCGDGSIVNNSPVHNFAPGGVDGSFLISADPETCDAGTVGAPVPWALALDDASFLGCAKIDATSTFANSPAIQTTDTEIDTLHDFSVNLWIKRAGWAQIKMAGTDSYYATGYYGGGPVGGDRFHISTPDEIVASGDPPPTGLLHLVLTDNIDPLTLSGGFVLEDGEWHMITATWVTSSNLLSLYADGGLIDSGTYIGTDIIVTNPEIGYVHLNGGNLNGLIDEVGIWCDEALTAGDVATLFFAGAPPPPVTASDIDSGIADCGLALTAGGDGTSSWGNPCRDMAPFVLPAVGVVTVQDVVDALIAAGIVTQL